ncbi:MAG: serine/threonine-protein kinase HipA [Rhodothermales bacterium]|jgi:serine/threonine-protein kinase HipA
MDALETAEVRLWDSCIGAVTWDREQELGSFEYDRGFLRSAIQLAPLMMPLAPGSYRFPTLARESFFGLPGMLADCLPDKFGNLLIDQWLSKQGRDRASFSPVERLCYMGVRGMGALEFVPALRRGHEASAELQIERLVELANAALARQDGIVAEGVDDILRVGASAGGARAKAIVAWNPLTGEFRSGQTRPPPGFEQWLLKFDGVHGNADKELADPMGFGLIEYAYYEMAVAAGIEMSKCRILSEGERQHFMTRRFDRVADGGKLYMQSFCALGHYDFNQAGAYSYEQALDLTVRLGLGKDQQRQLFRRMVFNVLARNQDDHTKNIAFLMDKQGRWRLSPAYDVTYSYNPTGPWTSRHQMSVNGKRDDFSHEDLMAVGRRFRLGTGPSVAGIIAEVAAALTRWPRFAKSAGVASRRVAAIKATHRVLDH